MKNTNLAILIINRNDYDNTVECLQSLQDNNKDQDFSIILLDNNSQDSSKENLIQKFELQEISPSNWNCEKNDIFSEDKEFDNRKWWHVCLSLNDNYGFTGANNFGMKFAWQHNFKSIMRLNNDTIIKANFLESMLYWLDKYQNHLLSCRILFYPDTEYIRWLGSDFNRFGKPYGINTNKKSKDIDYPQKYIESNGCTWCCLMMSRQTMNKLWWQDNNYFFNVDDSDYSYDAKLKWVKSIIDTTTILYHKSARSVKDKPWLGMYYGLRNLILFRRKYFSWYTNIPMFFYVCIHAIWVLILYWLQWKNNLKFFITLFDDIIKSKYGKYSHK